jgi:hypothetical protein
MSKRTWLIALCLPVTTAPQASAQFSIEGEVGVTSLSDDADYLLGRGVAFGGTLGFNVAPSVMLTAHGDLGIHGGGKVNDDSHLVLGQDAIDAGVSLHLLAGMRLYPLAMTGSDPMPINPYVGASVGLGSIAWSYASGVTGTTGEDADGLAALIITPELGANLRVSNNLNLGLGARYAIHNWSKETVENHPRDNFARELGGKFGGHALTVSARLGLVF